MVFHCIGLVAFGLGMVCYHKLLLMWLDYHGETRR